MGNEFDLTAVGIFEEFWDTPKPVVGFHTECDPAVVVDENIRWLDVPMQDAGRVDVVERPQQLVRDDGDVARRERPPARNPTAGFSGYPPQEFFKSLVPPSKIAFPAVSWDRSVLGSSS